MTRMYEESAGSLNWLVGCKFDCRYCVPSYQRQMKRQGKRCKKCYDYTPHTHLERLSRPLPKTGPDGFIFFPSSGDPSFAPPSAVFQAQGCMIAHPNRRFLVQSKDPSFFFRYEPWPENCILGTTLETDDWLLARAVSYAPEPEKRVEALAEIDHPLKILTMEPLMKHNWHNMVRFAKRVAPFRIYVGLDSHPHENHLDEPTLVETTCLVKGLKNAGFDVRLKLIREAWNRMETSITYPATGGVCQ